MIGRDYNPRKPKMTWEQRAKASVDAKHLQAALAAKGGSRVVKTTSEALGRIRAEGLLVFTVNTR